MTGVPAAPTARRSYRVRLLVGGLIVLLTLALRLWGLNATSLWYDETFMLYHAQQGPRAAVLGLLQEDNALPLHGLLLSCWIEVAGNSEFSVRYLSVLLTTLGAPLVIQLGRSLTHRRTTGLGGALAYATLPIFVYYSQEVRMYALAIPLTAGFLWSGWRLVSRCGEPDSVQSTSRRRRDAVAYVLLGLLMLSSHLYTGLAWLTTAMWGALSPLLTGGPATARPGGKPRLRRGIAGTWWHTNIALALLALPIAGWALWRLRVDATAVSAIPAEALRFLPIIYGVGQYLAQPWNALFVVVAIASLCVTLMGCFSARTPHRTSRRLAGIWFLLTLTLPIVTLFLMTAIKAKWSERYLLPSWGVALVVAVGTGWELLLRRGTPISRPRLATALRGSGLLLISVWVALVTPALVRQSEGTWALAIQDEWHPKPDFRGVARHIEAHGGADDAIVVVGGYATSAVDYYYQGEAHLFGVPYDKRVLDTLDVVDLHDLEVLEREAGSHRRLWLVLWQHHLADPTNLIQSVLIERCRRLPVDEGFVNVYLLLFDLETCRPLDRLAEPATVLETAFEAPIVLEGYHLIKTETLWEVDLWWRTTGPLDVDYTVFVHLVGPDETIIAQHDHIAGADAYATSRWRVGTRLRDRFFLYVSESNPRMTDDLMAPGFCEDCTLRIGLYTPEGRLPLQDGREVLTIPIF